MPDGRNRVTGRYIKYYTFKTFIDHKGRKTYYLNDKETTKDDGNEVFKDIKKYGRDIARTDSSEEVTYEEIIRRLESSIDQYVEYIDDGRQYREACDRNAKIRAEIAEIRVLMSE
jgi:hypothetical protein